MDYFHKAVNKKVFQIEILRRNAGNEAEKHLGTVYMIFRSIHKADIMLQAKHILAVVIDEHYAAVSRFKRFVSNVNYALGLARAGFAKDYLYQVEPPSAFNNATEMVMYYYNLFSCVWAIAVYTNSP